MAKVVRKKAVKGYVVTDNRRTSENSITFTGPFSSVVNNTLDPMGATAPIHREDEPLFSQQELMDMVAKRFPQVGKGRFLVVRDFAPRKSGSIYIPETSQRPSTSGRVCVVHPETTENVKVGDHVVFAIFSGTELPLAKDCRVVVMKDEEVLCWIDDGAPDTLKLETEVL